MAHCPFMLLSVLYLHHEAALLLLADEDEKQLWWGSSILIALQILEWFVIWGETIWADPKTVVTSIWRELVTQVLISLHLNLWSTPSVYRSRHPLESPLARMWRVYQCLALHTETRGRINTGAHANSITHCLRVSLSSQIRKHDIIFLVSVYLCMHKHAQMHFSRCVHAPRCPHVVCDVKTLMSSLSWWPFLLCWCPVIFFFYECRADISGCVITAPQRHTASLLDFWQWPSSSPLRALYMCEAPLLTSSECWISFLIV